MFIPDVENGKEAITALGTDSTTCDSKFTEKPVERKNSAELKPADRRPGLFSRLSFRSSSQLNPFMESLPPHLKMPFRKMHEHFKQTLAPDYLTNAQQMDRPNFETNNNGKHHGFSFYVESPNEKFVEL